MVKKLKGRIASTLLAGAMALSMFNGASLPAFAADDHMSAGKIRIDVVDSTVYGADRVAQTGQTNSIQADMYKAISTSDISDALKDYWDNNLSNKDFLYTPQGLGTFDARMIYVFDVTQFDKDGNILADPYKDGDGSEDAATGKTHYTYEYLREVEAKQAAVYKCAILYVTRGGLVFEVGGDGSQTITDIGSSKVYNGATEVDNPDSNRGKYSFNWLVDNHWYVMIEDPNTALSGSGYNASADTRDSTAWQYIFKWDSDPTKNEHIISYGNPYDEVNPDTSNTVASKSELGIPLHNEVLRGNFSFRVYDKDLLAYENQGAATIGGSKFAVYNISSTATGQNGQAYKWESNWANDGTKTGGYVIADRNLNGRLEDVERLSYIPAYSEEEIIAAYTEYLDECNSNKKGTEADPLYNGNYNAHVYGKDGAKITPVKKDAGKNVDEYGNIDVAESEFIIGNLDNGKPIIPVMVLEPDENGVVSTGTYGLPTGNYIVLQVQAGKGYHIDQDFRPIISMGYWAGLPDEGYAQHVGYGRAYYGGINNTYVDTLIYMQNCIKNKNDTVKVMKTNSPVVFCPTGKVTTDISAIRESDVGYFVANSNGGLVKSSDMATWMRANGPVYSKGTKGAANGKYIMNAKDERMAPVAGTSRLAVYNPVIRGGFKTYVADKDDVQKVADNTGKLSGINITLDGKYIVVSQGNGDLNGAQFELKPLSKAADTRVKLYTTNKILNPGAFHVYTVEYDRLLIPVDDLPYGKYSLRQISAGEGYEPSDWGIATIIVSEEDKPVVFTTNQVDADGDPIRDPGDPSQYVTDPETGKYKVGTTLHTPNQLVDGGEIYSLSSSTAPSDTEVTLSIYNISDHYVYTDVPQAGGATKSTRFETNKYIYDKQIAGKSLTYAQVQKIIGAWKPCKTVKLGLGDVETLEDTLPYGTYLIIASCSDPSLAITGDFMKEDSIDYDNDHIEFDVNIEDPSMIPIVDTIFTDASTNLDSIPVKNKVYLQDKVTVTNLNGGTKYVIYGAIIDKATGNLLKKGAVAYVTGTAYSATDDISGNASASQNMSNASRLYNDPRGQGATSFDSEGYVAWLQEVRDFANSPAVGNNTLAGYCDKAIADGSKVTGPFSPEGSVDYFEDDRARILGTLKYLARGEDTDEDIDGELEVVVNFEAIDTRNMEGKTFVAYEYVCSDTNTISKDALAATTAGGIIAALGNTLVADHRSLSDEDQTVYVPTLDITAEASYTGEKTIDPSENVKATVSYGNLEIGNKYKIKAWLVDGFGAKVPFVDENGDPVDYLLDEITAYSTTGESVFEFENVDASKYNKQRLTVYATLYRNERDYLTNANKDYWLVEKGDGDSMGYNINDKDPGKNQVDVKAPTVKTKLGDKYGRKTVNFDKKVTLTDTVTYKGLVPGGNYNAKLTLVSSDGAGLFDDEGNELTAEYRFTATKADMTIKIPIEFKGESLLGMDIIAYNDLYRQTADKISLVASEHNLLEEDQTIEATGDGFKVVVSTVASNPANNTHVVAATSNASAIDEVTVRNLEPLTQYVAKTKLVYAKNGRDITQFSPVTTYFESDEKGRAKFNVAINFNALIFKGQAITVVQTIYDEDEDEVIARHDDYNDANQMLYIPDIDTVATADDGVSKKIVPEEKIVNLTNDPDGKKETTYVTEVHDKITYKNLIPGNTYKITTEVVTRDGRASLGTTSMQFIPDTMAGDVMTYIELDVSDYFGSQLVVYETIIDAYSGDEVIVHKDLSDTDQTVEIVSREPDDTSSTPGGGEESNNSSTTSTPSTPTGDPGGKPDTPTGGGTNIDTGVDERYAGFFWLGGGILAIAGALIGVLIYRRKKNG